MYKVNSTNTAMNKLTFMKTAEFTMKAYIICTICFTLVLLVELSMPVTIWVFTGEWTLFLYTRLPGIDASTRTGYIITTAYHCHCGILTYIGMTASDLLVFIFLIQTVPMSQAICDSVDDLNRELVVATNRSSTVIAIKLRNIMLMHKEYYWYVKYTLCMNGPIR